MDQILKSDIYTAVIKALEGNLDERSLISLMDRIPKSENGSLEAEALHQTLHFLADKDIRLKDKCYDDNLRENLRTYLHKLRR